MKRYIKASNDREEQEAYYTLGKEIEKSLIDAGLAVYLKSVSKRDFLSGAYQWEVNFHADTKDDRIKAEILITNTPKYHNKFQSYSSGFYDFSCEAYHDPNPPTIWDGL